MAEKYTFSIEDSLLDALGFIKKIATTIIDMIFRPWRLVINTYEGIEHRKKYAYNNHNNPENKYVSHFLYFVMISLTFLSYFKAFIFNYYNGITESSSDVIREANTYLANTTVVEKLLQYFPMILMMYIIISFWVHGLGYLFYERLKLKQSEAVYLFKRITYYAIGTAILLQLVPVLIRNILSEEWEDRLGNIFRWGYWTYYIAFLGFAIQDKATNVPDGHFSVKYFRKVVIKSAFRAGYYAFLIALIALITESAIYRTGYSWWLDKMGHFEYTPKIRLSNYEIGKDYIPINKVSINDSAMLLRTDVLVINEWKDVLIKNKGGLDISFIRHTTKGDKTTTIDFNIVPYAQHTDSLAFDFPVSLNTVKRISIESTPVRKQTIDSLEKVIGKDWLKIKYSLHYLPSNAYEEKVNQYIDVVFR